MNISKSNEKIIKESSLFLKGIKLKEEIKPNLKYLKL